MIASGDRHHRAKFTWDEVRAIRQRWSDRETDLNTLVQQYGVNPATIRDMVRGRTWIDPKYTPPAPRTGKDHSLAKLTQERVREIRQRYAEGIGTSQLAERYGVSATNISKIIYNRAWHDPEYTPPNQ